MTKLSIDPATNKRKFTNALRMHKHNVLGYDCVLELAIFAKIEIGMPGSRISAAVRALNEEFRSRLSQLSRSTQLASDDLVSEQV